MHDIEIRAPLSITLDVIDIEDSHLQSINFRYALRGNASSHAFAYDGTFWAEVAAFDCFLDDLRSHSVSEAVFNSIDADFVIHIKKTNLLFEWKIRTQGFGGGLSRDTFLQTSFTASLHHDHLAAITETFQNYPKWW